MRLPSPALVLSCIAVFLSAAGGAVAANQINGKQIKDGSITGKDIKNDSLTATDIKGDVRGPAGPAGPRGSQGAAAPVASGGGPVISYRATTRTIVPSEISEFVFAPCPGGQRPVGGSYRAQEGLEIAYDKFGDVGGGDPDSWMAVVNNPTMAPLVVVVEVACITVSSVSGF
jgi:hypothetical protein